jgi:ribosomal protein S18 acetylase RimI-like enzyme
MVEGGSTRHLPSGTVPVHAVPLGALGGIPTAYEPPVPAPTSTGLRTGTCHGIDELDVVFGTQGEAAHCWCQYDRMPIPLFESLDDEHRRELLGIELRQRPTPGVVATLGDERVGWCSVAPRSRFSRLRTAASTRSPVTAADDPGVWSVTCFVVRPGFRRQGVEAALLAGAIDHARSGGAGWLEAYPGDASGRGAAVDRLYRGSLTLFLAAGFEVVARPRPGRAIVRLEL